jgi:hypothetical protein
MPHEDDYWALDLPGLTKEEAERILEFARRETDVIGASAIDPEECMTAFLDRETVRSLAEAFRAISERNDVVQGMLEQFEDWLSDS